MNILVLNAGSSSQKTCLYRLPDNSEALPDAPSAPLWKGQDDGGSPTAESLAHVLRSLWEGPNAVIGGLGEIHAVGHRVVHGGAEFRESARVTPEVKAAIHRLAPLAPAHNPAALAGIEAVEAVLGSKVPQVAVFDTAFHRTLPDAAAVYPGPYDWVEQGIRRYGFHGINHQYVSERAAVLMGRDHDEPATLRLISCHLGNGCSLAAIMGGKSIDTTMGFTPLDGLMMGTRSGAIDPGILLYLLQEKGVTAEALNQTLNQESGLKGISGLSGDMRDVEAAAAVPNPFAIDAVGDRVEAHPNRAHLALDIYLHRLRAGIGAMLASLGGVDALIFTAGVGEHSSHIRAGACEPFAFLGLRLDPAKNEDANNDADRGIAAAGSTVRVLVIQAQEDWAIAKECRRLLP